MRNATMAMLLGICAACSNQTATSPASPPATAKPPSTAARWFEGHHRAQTIH